MKSIAPTLASGLTTSSIMHGLAGGTPLAHAAVQPLPLGPHQGGAGTNRGSLSAATHSYASGMQGVHVVHPPKV